MHLIAELQKFFVSHIVVIECSIATTIKDEIAWYCNGIHISLIAFILLFPIGIIDPLSGSSSKKRRKKHKSKNLVGLLYFKTSLLFLIGAVFIIIITSHVL